MADVRGTLMREGAFRGMRTLLASGQISGAEASATLRRVYGSLLTEVKEARSELRHLEGALARIENICRTGSMMQNASPNDTNYEMLTQNVITFDAWAVSLMETNLTITGILNPQHTREKIKEFGVAMNALMDKRAAEQHPSLDDPSLFRNYVDR
jgi:hypothetical protein